MVENSIKILRYFLFLGVVTSFLVLMAQREGWASPEFDSAPVSSLTGGDFHFQVKSRTSLPLSSLNPRERFQRTQGVLEHFKVQPEEESQPLMQDLDGKQTLSGLKAILPFMDPRGMFDRFIVLGEESRRIEVFQDFESKEVKDFIVQLGEEGIRSGGLGASSSTDFHSRLLEVHRNPSDRPLAGLKIALDPGHMGGDLWDHRTGKFVRDGKGRKLSEGVMALQTALLLETEFQSLGAEVFLTRRKLAPVTSISYESLDIPEAALHELRESSLRTWFQSLLSFSPPQLYDAFSASADFKKLFGQNMRLHYFNVLDLTARSQAIQAFAPDITLIIHFDANDPPGNPNGINPSHHDGTKAYLPGGYGPEEFSSRADRRFFARHLLNAQEWNASFALGRSVIGSIRESLQIPLDHNGGGDSVEVEPGIFARNLYVQRLLSGAATSYVECAYYNDAREFSEFNKADHFLQIDDTIFPYSNRLVQVVMALKQAVLGFVQNYGNR